MRPTFADPKTDFVFKRIFGTESHKSLLISLLNDLLARDHAHRITDLTYLPAELKPPVPELKASIVDVKCQDASGTLFVVEMQVLNVEGFEKRVVYNGSKAYVRQLETGDKYSELHDVIGISICDFQLWPDRAGEVKVPLVSRWRKGVHSTFSKCLERPCNSIWARRNQARRFEPKKWSAHPFTKLKEEQSGRVGLSQVQYVFVELPKFAMNAVPKTAVEQWAYFFRHAETLKEIPTLLTEKGPLEALEVAKTSHFTEPEWDAYDRARMAEQDARGALSLAQRLARDEGRVEGRTEGELNALRRTLQRILRKRFNSESDARVDACDEQETLEQWIERAMTATDVEEVFRS